MSHSNHLYIWKHREKQSRHTAAIIKLVLSGFISWDMGRIDGFLSSFLVIGEGVEESLGVESLHSLLGRGFHRIITQVAGVKYADSVPSAETGVSSIGRWEEGQRRQKDCAVGMARQLLKKEEQPVFLPVVHIDDDDKPQICAVPKLEEERSWPCAIPKREVKSDPGDSFFLRYSAALGQVLSKADVYSAATTPTDSR